MRQAIRAGPGVLAGLVGAAVAILLFSSTGHDDCHITFWSAWSLAELGEIVNHSGERLEQSSSLLHTLVLALSYRLTGISLSWLAYFVGIAAAVATVARIPALARATGLEIGFGGLLVVATAPTFAYWQLGGLESSLMSLCALEFVLRLVGFTDAERATTRGDRIGLVLWTGALVLVRPEAGLVASAVTLVLTLLSLRQLPSGAWRGPAFVLGVTLAWFAGVTAWRLAYFGEPFPHPVLSKIGGSGSLAVSEQLSGLGYLFDRLAGAAGPVLLVGLVLGIGRGLAALRAQRLHAVVPLTFVLAYLAFAVAAGGDWMKGWRFVAHVAPLIVFLLLEGLFALVRRERARRWTGVLVLVQVTGLIGLGSTVGTGRPLWTNWQVEPAILAYSAGSTWPERGNQVHTRDVVMVDEMLELVGRILEDQERVSILSGQGGLVMFHVAKEFHGRIDFYDRLGLVSSHYDETRREFDLPTGPMGLEWTLTDLFRLQRSRDDPIYHPDVIFDLFPGQIENLERNGYRIVYLQSGKADGHYRTRGEARHELIDAERDDLGRRRRNRPQRGIGEPGPAEEPEEPESRFVRRLDRRLTQVEPFWRSETPMYQFIAVREEIAERAGLVDVRDLLESSPRVESLRNSRTMVWEAARKPHLRFFFQDPL